MFDDLASKLKVVMEHYNLKQKDLSDITGITSASISMFLNRKGVQSLGLDFFYKVCKRYNIDLLYFIECDINELFTKKIVPIPDHNYQLIIGYIDTIFMANDKDLITWFLVQFKKSFNDFITYSEKKNKELSDTSTKKII